MEDRARRVQPRRRFFALFDDDEDGHGFTAIVQENKDGSLLWTAFDVDRPGYLDENRAGFLIYRRRGGG